MAANSKQVVLAELQRTLLDPVALPDLAGPWTEYEHPRQQFAEVLAAVGGRAVVVRDLPELNAELAKIDTFRGARRVCSLLSGIERANVTVREMDDPHAGEDVDFFVAPGEFAVAENGAVWLTDEVLKHRVLYFLTQHLVLVVPAREIVSNMHQAYQRIRFDKPGFGLFLSGPSKTADIEQSLVIGAHGARSLTVFLLESSLPARLE
jgi:L-lactate dehydrogenase complex protein LldG